MKKIIALDHRLMLQRNSLSLLFLVCSKWFLCRLLSSITSILIFEREGGKKREISNSTTHAHDLLEFLFSRSERSAFMSASYFQNFFYRSFMFVVSFIACVCFPSLDFVSSFFSLPLSLILPFPTDDLPLNAMNKLLEEPSAQLKISVRHFPFAHSPCFCHPQ